MIRKTLVNKLDAIVPEAIDGLLLSNPLVKRLGDLNVIVRSDIHVYKSEHVTIISGGGSGHEPSHAGFIGDGMLSAAVCGNIFASPSVSSILAAIRVCAGPLGVLLIVKNYTGDRLNFGMALESAKQEGIHAKMLIVADDMALPEGKGITGGRGVAGTVFMHKITGSLAANKHTLDYIYNYASKLLTYLGSMGIALSVCSLPGSIMSDRLSDPTIMEVGMGIHGESGREQISLSPNQTADQVAEILVDSIVMRLKKTNQIGKLSNYKVVMLLNNLGAIPVIEMSIVLRRVIIYLKETYHMQVIRVFSGPYMTSLDMAGLSLSCLLVSEDDMTTASIIDDFTTAPAWVKSPDLTVYDAAVIPYTTSTAAKVSGGIACIGASSIITAIARRIIDIEATLTQYDLICGDGDCGIVAKAGAEKVLSDLASYSESDSALLCDSLATSISASMGGTSGALLEIMFRRMATYIATTGTNSGMTAACIWGNALLDGVAAIKLYGGASVGMRTMLDALEPAIQSYCKSHNIVDAAVAAKIGVENTKTMTSLAGRSNYVESTLMDGIPDPGAYGVAEAFAVAATLL